jgi:hypothetical protein
MLKSHKQITLHLSNCKRQNFKGWTPNIIRLCTFHDRWYRESYAGIEVGWSLGIRGHDGIEKLAQLSDRASRDTMMRVFTIQEQHCQMCDIFECYWCIYSSDLILSIEIEIQGSEHFRAPQRVRSRVLKNCLLVTTTLPPAFTVSLLLCVAIGV